MNLDFNDNIEIKCEKIKHNEKKGLSVVKISVDDQDTVKSYFVYTVSNRSYINDSIFFKNALLPIIKEQSSKGKKIDLNFSQGFPLMEISKYKTSQEVNSIDDETSRNVIFDFQKELEVHNVTLGKQFIIFDKYNAYNEMFRSFAENEANNDVTHNVDINKIVFSEEKKSINPNQDNNYLFIEKYVDENKRTRYLIKYADKKLDKEKFNIVSFSSDKQKYVFFKRLLKDFSQKTNARVFSNEEIIHNIKIPNLKKSKLKLENKTINLLRNNEIFNFYNNRNNEFYTNNIPDLLRNIKGESQSASFNYNRYLSWKTQQRQLDYLENNEISGILIKRIHNDDNENYLAVIAEMSVDEETNKREIKYHRLSVDLNMGNDDETTMSKFEIIFKNKLGYSMNEAKSENAVLAFDGFEDKNVLAWMIKERFKTDLISLGFEHNTRYINVMKSYEENNIESMRQKNKLSAKDGPTDKDTICVYSDASMYESKPDSFTYGAVIRTPNADSIIKEVSGIKSYKRHNGDTKAAEETGVIESLKSLKLLMEQGVISKNLKVEVRVDNIDVIDNLFGKNGKNKKVSDLYSSKINKPKDVNELLSYFKNVDFRWIKGHCNDLFNERADSLAKKGWELEEHYGFKKGGHKKVVSEKIEKVIPNVTPKDIHNSSNNHQNVRPESEKVTVKSDEVIKSVSNIDKTQNVEGKKENKHRRERRGGHFTKRRRSKTLS